MADAMAPKRKYCVNCLADATAVRVRCADCPDIELCLECFASGAELGTHRRGHAFRLEDAGTFPLFDDPGAPGPRAPPWSCLEEQQLLEAVEQHGLGNWADVGAHVNAAWCSAMGGPTGTGGGGGPGPGVGGGGGGSGGGGTPAGAASGGGPGARSPADVARHFMAAYVYGSVGRACVPEVIPNRVTDHTAPEPPVDRGGGGSSSPPPPPVPPISAEEQQTLGYMPLRDDFEMEFLPHAETPVSELPSFEPDEVALVTEAARSSSSSSSAAALDHHDGAQLLELELKMAVVCAYVRALHQRELRKAAAREYGLVQAFFGRPCALQAAYAATTAQGAGASPPTAASGGGTQAASQSQEPPAKRKMAKEEKELLHKLRPLCRLVPAREFVELLEGARRERCLRERVRELQRARARSGVRRLDDFAALRRNKRRFGQAQQQQQQGAGSGTSGHNGRERADAAAADAEAEDACGYARALSERESALCSSMNLSPARYVTAKTIAVLQSSTHRHARRLQQQQQQAQQQVLGQQQQQQGKGRSQGAVPLGQGALPMLLEKAVRKKLMGFLGRSGWVGGAGGREVL